MHDFNPGIAPNGLFWTMEIPRSSLNRFSSQAVRLKVDDLPMPDTFFYSNNVSVSAQVSVDVTWNATSFPARRGEGASAAAPYFGKFAGELAEATCVGKGSGAETGFTFETGQLTSSGFFAEFGTERNGVFLT